MPKKTDWIELIKLTRHFQTPTEFKLFPIFLNTLIGVSSPSLQSFLLAVPGLQGAENIKGLFFDANNTSFELRPEGTGPR